MAFAKFQENRLRIDGEIAENHAILVNLTASIRAPIVVCRGERVKLVIIYHYPLSADHEYCGF